MRIAAELMFAAGEELPVLPGQLADLSDLFVQDEANALPEWKRKRLGKITASNFCKIKKVKGGKFGEETLSYIYDLIGEHLSGEESQSFSGSKATYWGEAHEDEAAEVYAEQMNRTVRPAQFLQHPDLPWVGATPDREVSEVGLLEIKCPFNYKNHIRTVRSGKVPADYLPQVLGQLWLSNRFWVDFVSYDPRIKGPHRLAIVRIWKKDVEQEIADLAELITEAHGLLLSELAALGVEPGVNFNWSK